MPIKRHPHSIRFSEEEWNSVIAAAKCNDISPADFVRNVSARAAAEELDLAEPRLTPELVELIKRTFRGVHLLAYLKREELGQTGQRNTFQLAATAALTAQSETLSRQD